MLDQQAMYISGLVFVEWDGSFDDLRSVIADSIGLPFHKDDSGVYEEFPSWQGRFCNVYVALLDRPTNEKPRATLFQINALTDVPTGTSNLVFADVSSNLMHVLEQQGLSCFLTPPEGYHWFAGG